MQTKKINLVYLDCDLIPKADSTKAEGTCFALHLFRSAVFWKGCKFLTFCIDLNSFGSSLTSNTGTVVLQTYSCLVVCHC